MNSVLRSVTLMLGLALVCPLETLAQKGGLRYTIAVESFANESNWRGQIDLGNQLGTVLTSLLHESGRFIVVGEESTRAAALGEQDLAASSRGARGSRRPATGHMTAAQLLVRGAITHVQHDTAKDTGGTSLLGGRLQLGGGRQQTEINVTINLVDTTSGQVVASQRVVGKASKRRGTIRFRGRHSDTKVGSERNDNMMSALEAAAGEAIGWLADQLEGVQWQGAVVKIDGDRIFVNRGTREGVSRGQEFSVGPVEVVRDNGEIIGRFLKEVARIEVAEVQSKISICRIKSGQLSDLRKNFGVRPAS